MVTKQFPIFLKEEEKKLVKKVADQESLSMSAFIRRCAVVYSKEKLNLDGGYHGQNK